MNYPAQPTHLDQQELQQLVLAAQDGDRSAFDTLFEHFQRTVYVTAYRRLCNDAEAQELVQDVFIQAMRKIGQLDDPLCFGGWIRSIAHRMAINRAMRTRYTVSLESDRFETDSVNSPVSQVLADERSSQVHDGLDRLNPLDRDTLIAFYFQGQSIVEMSDEFDSPVGTIKRRLHVARKRLARELASLEPA